jgi:site-specific DNA-methyltransferase (adenine-specific)
MIFDETAASLLGDKQRFFYCVRAQPHERHAGVERNTHPCVKPVDLMRYLCRLITPPCGLILDPFMGSGSTGIAAYLEGFNFIGIEREEEYYNIAQQRLEHWSGVKTTPLQDKPEKKKGQLDLF